MLMENSVYAREDELREGFFTAKDGCRIGVCGKLCMREGKVAAMSAISSLCIRIPREIKGCADAISGYAGKNLLLASPPGCGKTTLLRDFIRRVSDGGMNVCVADERREICGCREGIPQLDVGSRTDVMDGCPKAISIPMMIRSCAPDLIAADEIGGHEDAEALREAKRCGVKIVATVHASSVEDMLKRAGIGELLREGIFDYAVMLGGVGRILEIRKFGCGVDKA